MPKCPEAGRYHVPKALKLFVLDKEGEALAPSPTARQRAGPPSSTSPWTADGVGPCPATR